MLQPDEACLFCDVYFVFESFAQVHEDVARGLITDKINTDREQGCQISCIIKPTVISAVKKNKENKRQIQ